MMGRMSNTKVDIKALAALAKLSVSDVELARLENELPAILSFVETIQKVAADSPAVESKLRNVMRDDTDAYPAGTYTEALLSAAPAREGNRVLVKQVLHKNKK